MDKLVQFLMQYGIELVDAKNEFICKALKPTQFPLEKINEILWVRERILTPTPLNKFVGKMRKAMDDFGETYGDSK